jgi:hypothetical protein
LVISALRERGVDVLTVQEDGRESLPDPAVLDRATELGRVLFSQDDDLLGEAARRQRAGVSFSGVIFAHQQEVAIRLCIDDLELIATACEALEFQDRVEYLPLRPVSRV